MFKCLIDFLLLRHGEFMSLSWSIRALMFESAYLICEIGLWAGLNGAVASSVINYLSILSLLKHFIPLNSVSKLSWLTLFWKVPLPNRCYEAGEESCFLSLRIWTPTSFFEVVSQPIPLEKRELTLTPEFLWLSGERIILADNSRFLILPFNSKSIDFCWSIS